MMIFSGGLSSLSTNGQFSATSSEKIPTFIALRSSFFGQLHESSEPPVVLKGEAASCSRSKMHVLVEQEGQYKRGSKSWLLLGITNRLPF